MWDTVSLPRDIILDISMRLPVKTLLICRSISKSFCQIIDDPLSANMHLSKSPQNYFPLGKISSSTYYNNKGTRLDNYHLFFLLEEDENSNLWKEFEIRIHMESKNVMYMIGSCNGLFLFVDKKEFHIVNPFRRKEIKCVSRPPSFEHPYANYGFGFDESTQRFKIVCLQIHDDYFNNHSKVSVFVHDLCHGSTPCSLSFREVSLSIEFEYKQLYVYGKSILVDGDFYWIVKLFGTGSVMTVMVSFNLKMESTEVIQLPTISKNSHPRYISLFYLDGSLGMIDSSHILKGVTDIWVLTRNNVDNGNYNTNIWVNKFRIQLPEAEIDIYHGNVEGLGILGPSRVLVRRSSSNKYYIVDLKTGLIIEKSRNYLNEHEHVDCCHRASLITPTRLVVS